jgi:hypothetical protein
VLTSRGRIICGVLAGALLGWMIVLLLHPPKLTYGSDHGRRTPFTVTCDRPIAVIGETLEASDVAKKSDVRRLHFYGRGIPDEADRARIEMDCIRHHTAVVAWMAVLAVPASVLGALAFVAGAAASKRDDRSQDRG